MTSKLFNLSVQTPRKLPVILLLDTSKSMSKKAAPDAPSRINYLNEAVSTMLADFKEVNQQPGGVQIYVAIIGFGGEQASLICPFTNAAEMNFEPLTTAGKTPMGDAFTLAKNLVEDKTLIEARDYRPYLILVSDGGPTDTWKTPLKELIKSERASKALRFSVAIGKEFEEKEALVLFSSVYQQGQCFYEIDEKRYPDYLPPGADKVFLARDAKRIKDFLKAVTMSVIQRTKVQDPPKEEPPKEDPPTAGAVNKQPSPRPPQPILIIAEFDLEADF